jgi:hypothetical protein
MCTDAFLIFLFDDGIVLHHASFECPGKLLKECSLKAALVLKRTLLGNATERLLEHSEKSIRYSVCFLQIPILPTSSRFTSSPRRSYSPVVRDDASHDLLCNLQLATILKISGNAGRPKVWFPTIRTKALSRDTRLSQCSWHRLVARGWRTKISGNLTVNHLSVKRIVPRTIDTA